MGVKRKWSAREIKMLDRYYAWRGSQGMVELFKRRGFQRNRKAITQKARRMGIDGYAPIGHTAITDLSSGWGLNFSTRAVRSAVADGVLKRAAVAYVVPNWWADKYMERIMREHNEAVRVEGYVTLRDVARFARMKYKTLLRQYHDKRSVGAVLYEYDIRVVRDPYRRYVVHPDVLRDPRIQP